jgi:hypothetical protein
MRVGTVDISRLTPDPNQPRKTFPPDSLEQLSKSLLEEGFINPIETDSNFMIITGERRYRAALAAGIKKVPVHVNDNPLTPVQRLKRQIIENFLQGRRTGSENMGTGETLRAFVRYLELVGRPLDRSKKGHGVSMQGRFLAQEFGGNPLVYEDLLQLYGLPDMFIDSINEQKTAITARSVAALPSSLKEAAMEKFIKSDAISVESIRTISRLAKKDASLAIVALDRLGREHDKVVNAVLTNTHRLESAINAARDVPDLSSSDKTILRNFLSSLQANIAEFMMHI